MENMYLESARKKAISFVNFKDGFEETSNQKMTKANQTLQSEYYLINHVRLQALTRRDFNIKWDNQKMNNPLGIKILNS